MAADKVRRKKTSRWLGRAISYFGILLGMLLLLGTIPEMVIAGTNNVGVTDYLVKEDPSPPLQSDLRWSSSAPTSFTFTTYGNNTLYAWVRDAAGNVSAPVSASCLVLDPDTKIDTVIIGQPANTMAGTSATFKFIASKSGAVIVATFECSLDGRSYSACVSPVTFDALAYGSHVFSVRSKDAGNVDLTPPTYIWTVSAPIVRINPTYYTSIASAYAASSDGNSLEVRGIELAENLDFDRPVAISLKGGFDSAYSSTNETSTIHGTMTISIGTVVVDNISIN